MPTAFVTPPPRTVEAPAPTIGESCSLDPDERVLQHPGVASFVPEATPAFSRERRLAVAGEAEPADHDDAPLERAPRNRPAAHRGGQEALPALAPSERPTPAPVLLLAPAPADGERLGAPVPVPAARPVASFFEERAPEPSRNRRRTLLIAGGVAAVVLVVAGALVAAPLLSGSGSAQPAALDGPTSAAVAWLPTAVSPLSVVAAPDELVGALTEAGVPSASLLSESTLDSAAPDSAWRAVDFVLSTPALRSGATGETGTALAHSATVASFGSGDAAVELRRVVDRGSTGADTAALASAGTALAANPALTTTPAVKGLLESGQVDERILALVNRQLATTPLSVADLPAGENEDASVPRHRLLLSGFAGAALPASETETAGAMSWLRGLTGLSAPVSIAETPAGLLVTLPLVGESD
ncbi:MULTISPECIES: hypothetical protein [unclassified Rathayibacter]|uniref:hypothetical protein n=1 Tax=unclassified Rathayibacter TaxID=2609250 RepID=UPI00188A56FD|nr:MULTISPECIES: hypothetical protein [unclassified Rathayibacter]MBF4462574.1 hypothetical protein [Rathayibacter sp. VKM Ac-2879]MBF4503383.1 hypothetical protein [Rathayibacter sp. VKM Ac-2878]